MTGLKSNTGVSGVVYADKGDGGIVKDGWSMGEESQVAHFSVKGKVWGFVRCQAVKLDGSPEEIGDGGPVETIYVGRVGRGSELIQIELSTDWQEVKDAVETAARTLQSQWADLYYSINS